MIHYDTADWVDYLRGLGEPSHRVAMSQHLRNGCRSCRSTLGRLAAVARHVAADEAFEPPESALRFARALFSQFRPERVCALPRLLARLVQDSLREPLPVGVRGNERASRQALYEAGTMFVDLRLEQRPGRSAVALVGQLLCADDPCVAVARRPVVLTSGPTVLSATASNEHGEFHLDYEPDGVMRLHIPVDEGSRRIEIMLNPLTPDARTRDVSKRRRLVEESAGEPPRTGPE